MQSINLTRTRKSIGGAFAGLSDNVRASQPYQAQGHRTINHDETLINFNDDRSEGMCPSEAAFTDMVQNGESPEKPRDFGQTEPKQITTQSLMQDFTRLYSLIEERLERAISYGKDQKLDAKLRASTNSALIGTNGVGQDVTCEMLDLKADMVALKNQKFEVERQHRAEIEAKTEKLAELERLLKE